MDRVRLVCNRFGREAGYLEAADVEATLGRKLHWTLPDDWKTSSTSVNVGTPLMEWAPKSKLRNAYRQVALALAQGGEGAGETAALADGTGGDPKTKGLFSIFAGQKQG
jgi:hypothetical protein